MDNKFDLLIYIKIAVVAVGGFLGGILGGWDVLLEVLITFVIIDYATGIAKALMGKSDKTSGGGLASSVMFKGGLRKILIFAVIAVAVVADRIISPDSTLIRSGAIVYYLSTEGLSILENVILCGVPVPDKLKDILENLKKDGETK